MCPHTNTNIAPQSHHSSQVVMFAIPNITCTHTDRKSSQHSLIRQCVTTIYVNCIYNITNGGKHSCDTTPKGRRKHLSKPGCTMVIIELL